MGATTTTATTITTFAAEGAGDVRPDGVQRDGCIDAARVNGACGKIARDSGIGDVRERAVVKIRDEGVGVEGEKGVGAGARGQCQMLNAKC